MMRQMNQDLYGIYEDWKAPGQADVQGACRVFFLENRKALVTIYSEVRGTSIARSKRWSAAGEERTQAYSKTQAVATTAILVDAL
jgi:hypothetical protein